MTHNLLLRNPCNMQYNTYVCKLIVVTCGLLGAKTVKLTYTIAKVNNLSGNNSVFNWCKKVPLCIWHTTN